MLSGGSRGPGRLQAQRAVGGKEAEAAPQAHAQPKTAGAAQFRHRIGCHGDDADRDHKVAGRQPGAETAEGCAILRQIGECALPHHACLIVGVTVVCST